ncbi:MAG: TRAP transporter fused permease subunit [Spirochaetales bacterium]|nr:TRAP transporter fused permease subunit [Spirochaetales bacterium]
MLVYICYWFGLPFPGGVLEDRAYFYLLFTLLSPMIFPGIRSRRTREGRGPGWYDYLLSALFFSVFFICFLSSEKMAYGLWMISPSALHIGIAAVILLLSIEAGRRAAGWSYVLVIVACALYSLFADRFSGPLYGVPVSPVRLITDFAFGQDGILGVPASLIGKSMLGFYVFAATMQGLGGSTFFINTASALFGKSRGGTAKTAVIASGLFGSLSGSISANVMTTGTMTIPAMKKAGYSAEYAAASEACASSGGDTMPPVMGGLAFIAAMVANFEYSEIMIAAFLPTVLYYFGLLIQVDGYAAVKLRNPSGSKHGESESRRPDLAEVIIEGWHFLISIAFLVFGLVHMKWGYISPLYASALAIALSAARRQTGFLERLKNIFIFAGRQISFGLAIFLGTGIIMVSLYKTGMASALTSWIVSLGSENLFAVLLIGALFNLFMGMLGLQRSSYLFLAVTMAPAVSSLGNIPEVAVHLFLIFYAGMGGLTPPVAITAYLAANIAGADRLKTALTSLRLGFVLLILPFFFILQPALILQGALWKILLFGSAVFFGVFLTASAIEGYLAGRGVLRKGERIILGLFGLLTAFPDLRTLAAGVILGGAFYLKGIKRSGHRSIGRQSIGD